MDKLIVGCGYLGRRVARAWLAEGDRVFALTRSPANAVELQDMGITPVIGDICHPDSLTELPAVHTVLFAVGYDRSSGKSQREVYVDGLKSVLQVVGPASDIAARGKRGQTLSGHTISNPNRLPSKGSDPFYHGLRGCQRFLYVSSSSVYGQSEGECVDETSVTQPVQPGGLCCLEAEQLVLSTFADQESNSSADGRIPFANVLRFSGIYGPDRLLSRVAALRAGDPIAGRGDAWLNLIHVDDGVRAIQACEALGKPGQTYLVSDDAPVLRSEYYGHLALLTGSPAPTFAPETAPSRGSGGINKRCSNRRLRDDLKVNLAYPTITVGLPHAIDTSVDSSLRPKVH
ncbi:MAG: NAD-dependent epimerase/dehydratase family protein [Planctomycetaceae bacterium]